MQGHFSESDARRIARGIQYLDGLPRAFVGQPGTANVGDPVFSPVIALVKNNTNASLLVGNCVALSTQADYAVAGTGPLTDPGTDLPGFLERLALAGVGPGETTDPVGVLLDALDVGEIGRAVVSGVTPALVVVNDTSHRYCQPDSSGQCLLESVAVGPIALIWAGTGNLVWGGNGSDTFDGEVTDNGGDTAVSDTGLQWGIVGLGLGNPFSCDLLANVCGGITQDVELLNNVTCNAGGGLVKTFTTLRFVNGLLTAVL